MAAPKKTPKSTKKQSRGVSPNNEKVATLVKEEERKVVTHLDVYFYIPNLTGYARVILTIVGIGLLVQANRYKTEDWKLGLVLYTLSFILDFFDGYFARMFKQSSNFGAVLDMVTDRVSTMLLLVVLTQLYPEFFEAFAFLAGLDYSSHWVQMYASKGHHKDAKSNQDKNIIVRVFYGVYPFFGFCCAGTEIFYIAMAARKFNPNIEIVNFLLPILFVACVSKNVVNVAQLLSGFEAVAKRDAAASRGEE